MGLFDNKKDNNFVLFSFMNDEDNETSSDELDDLGLSEFQKEEVKKGNYDSWNPEYEALEDGDKEALKYLVMAGFIFENIEYQIDDHHNVPFKKFLEEEVEKGNYDTWNFDEEELEDDDFFNEDDD